MKKINKDNVREFIDYYHGFHDSYIKNINYNIFEAKIEMLIDVCWSGTPILKDDGTYQTNKVGMKMIFHGILKYTSKEMFSWDYVNHAMIKYIKLDNKEFICFASDENDPLVYIVCDNIEYEEMTEKWMY